MKLEHTHTVITAENAASVRESLPCDMRDAPIGAETWGIIYQPGNQRGQMVRVVSGALYDHCERGGIMTGGDTAWGDWYDGVLTLDECDDEGNSIRYDEDGDLV